MDETRKPEVDFFGYRLAGPKATLSLIGLFLVVGLLSALPFVLLSYQLDF